MAIAQNLSEMVEQARATVLSRCPQKPRLGIILGSGLGGAVSGMKDPVTIPFGDIPHFPTSGVVGHAGELRIGEIEGLPAAVMLGRVHMYEGYSPEQVTFPIRLLAALGVETLVITNAAGALDPGLSTGDLLLIGDQINATGASPYTAAGIEDLTLFVDMADVYEPGLRALIRDSVDSVGVYVGVRGPQYETPAELDMYRKLGGHAIGMSTVLEAIVARQLGLGLLGISCITNQPLADRSISHAEVVAAGKALEPRLGSLLSRFAGLIASS